MKTITLSYDGSSSVAKKGLEYILSLGVFKVVEDYEPNEETLEAMKELREGGGTVYNSVEEMINDALK